VTGYGFLVRPELTSTCGVPSVDAEQLRGRVFVSRSPYSDHEPSPNCCSNSTKRFITWCHVRFEKRKTEGGFEDVLRTFCIESKLVEYWQQLLLPPVVDPADTDHVVFGNLRSNKIIGLYSSRIGNRKT